MESKRPKDVDPELLRAHLIATRETGDDRETAGRYETIWTEEDDERHGPVHVAYEVWNNNLVVGAYKQTPSGVSAVNVSFKPLREISKVTLDTDEGAAVVVIGSRVQYAPLVIGQRILAAG